MVLSQKSLSTPQQRHNLTIAFPKPSCGLQFCYPSFFSSDFVHPKTLPANMITSHMRFKKTALQSIMPKDTKYTTIIREPASMFESLFIYYNLYVPSFKRVPNGSLESFLDDPLHYYKPEEGYSNFAHNTLTFDLGGDKDRPATDVAYAHDFVEEVDKVFSLVMISEYFDESLVLLRHLLSWDLEDILYIKLNARTESSKKKLSPDLSAKIRAWNSIDAYLYDYFNASLWVKLSELGLDCVEKEVQLLRQAQERLMTSCFGRKRPMERPGSKIEEEDLRPWQPNEKVGIIGYVLPENIDQETRINPPGLADNTRKTGTTDTHWPSLHRAPGAPTGTIGPHFPENSRDKPRVTPGSHNSEAPRGRSDTGPTSNPLRWSRSGHGQRDPSTKGEITPPHPSRGPTEAGHPGTYPGIWLQTPRATNTPAGRGTRHWRGVRQGEIGSTFLAGGPR
ncbi:galactose-3-O-sulfotransferase 3-like [Anableps anableps]